MKKNKLEKTILIRQILLITLNLSLFTQFSCGGYSGIDSIFQTGKVKEDQTILSKNGMIKVDGGSFDMGDGKDNNNKKHKVTVSSFYISKYETTQSEYQNIMGSNPSYFKGSNLPVENVSWYDAIKFCNAKSKKEGLAFAYNETTGELLDQYGKITTDITEVKGYRLSTEAEWEFAAKGGNKSQGYKYSGSNDENEVAWYDKNSGSKTHEVGTKKANELGIFDISGNVWELCTDWYDGAYYENSTDINPVNTKSSVLRVIRGGSWFYDAGLLRVGYRFYYTPSNTFYSLGFRLARTY